MAQMHLQLFIIANESTIMKQLGVSETQTFKASITIVSEPEVILNKKED